MSDGHTERGFGYWLNIFANLAVVGGIVFLAIQIRQNSQMMRAQTRSDLSNGIVSLLNESASNNQLASIMRRANAGDALTPDEGVLPR
jgi:hypothetical protein